MANYKITLLGDTSIEEVRHSLDVFTEIQNCDRLGFYDLDYIHAYLKYYRIKTYSYKKEMYYKSLDYNKFHKFRKKYDDLLIKIKQHSFYPAKVENDVLNTILSNKLLFCSNKRLNLFLNLIKNQKEFSG